MNYGERHCQMEHIENTDWLLINAAWSMIMRFSEQYESIKLFTFSLFMNFSLEKKTVMNRWYFESWFSFVDPAYGCSQNKIARACSKTYFLLNYIKWVLVRHSLWELLVKLWDDVEPIWYYFLSEKDVNNLSTI